MSFAFSTPTVAGIGIDDPSQPWYGNLSEINLLTILPADVQQWIVVWRLDEYTSTGFTNGRTWLYWLRVGVQANPDYPSFPSESPWMIFFLSGHYWSVTDNIPWWAAAVAAGIGSFQAYGPYTYGAETSLAAHGELVFLYEGASPADTQVAYATILYDAGTVTVVNATCGDTSAYFFPASGPSLFLANPGNVAIIGFDPSTNNFPVGSINPATGTVSTPSVLSEAVSGTPRYRYYPFAEAYAAVQFTFSRDIYVLDFSFYPVSLTLQTASMPNFQLETMGWMRNDGATSIVAYYPGTGSGDFLVGYVLDTVTDQLTEGGTTLIPSTGIPDAVIAYPFYDVSGSAYEVYQRDPPGGWPSGYGSTPIWVAGPIGSATYVAVGWLDHAPDGSPDVGYSHTSIGSSGGVPAYSIGGFTGVGGGFYGAYGACFDATGAENPTGTIPYLNCLWVLDNLSQVITELPPGGGWKVGGLNVAGDASPNPAPISNPSLMWVT